MFKDMPNFMPMPILIAMIKRDLIIKTEKPTGTCHDYSRVPVKTFYLKQK